MALLTESVTDTAESRPAVTAPMRRYLSTPILLLITAALVLFITNAYRFINMFQDDAFITYRFSEHLASGSGLVWNLGGERVEGFTSLLHVLLVSVLITLHVPALTGAFIVALGSLIGIFALSISVLMKRASTLHFERRGSLGHLTSRPDSGGVGRKRP